MVHSGLFRVKEFADLAGVSVRTLQYYDKEGLLKPSGGYTTEQHRRYRQEDLLRLQQILTLKYIGFSLEEIRDLLRSASYDVVSSLRVQKEAIDQRIVELQKVSASIELTIDTLSSLKPTELDWSLVSEMTRGLIASEKFRQTKTYFTPEQAQKLEQRRKEMTPQEMVESWRSWDELLQAFRKLLSEGYDPSESQVQLLAARQYELVQAFTQGDPGILENLKRLYVDYENSPAENRPYELELQKYMHQALEIYYKENGD